MDYAAEIEQIAAEARRRSALLMDEIDEINRQTSLRAEQFAVDAAERLRALSESEPGPDSIESVEPQHVQPEPPADVTRVEEVRAPAPFVPDPAMSPEEQRQAEIRAAVARARAAREARSTVAPSDGDYDSESEYYRRSTWLD
ncbi:hypothetical protein NN3_36640 [Nocardia neocaledoniensis NBRC 108232]|uniref:Uncharacterized protein n=1 Tax=Nocardia neocaledoniensis TaxID=236511 RepID=A0A317NUZ2_9NOCA|nr:hypothetical protein [Nocardia neocaledoniensis]PWV77628.1 hypothetical protein DFR69_103227 [Nocardia neocaledoniensis]GEM32657.1 hypothetical protein NN3_36640 [Nocardia neocaledoniensis NBRC 108232]